MHSLKSNYPHPDRCVVGASNLSSPAVCDQSKIKWSSNRQFNHKPVRAPKIGLGTEPRKMHRGAESTFGVKPVAKRAFK